jgi:hypothetical protein
MAITTLDGALAGMKPPEYYSKAVSGTLVAARPFSPFYLAGVPGAAIAPTPGLAGPVGGLTSYAGQLAIPAASGNTHLARFSGVSSAQSGMLLLCDRLWHNSGFTITSTAAQTINSNAWPARDANGTTNGDKVILGVEISGATGTGTPTITVSYTNQAGTAGRTATNTVATVATSAAGSFYPIGLAAGDTGVRSVQTLTLSATWTSGTMHLVAYRVLATLELSAAGLPNAVDALTSGMPRCYDGTVPFLIYIPQTTSTTQLSGQVVFTQG